jgi:hypothetical protein
VDCFDLSPFIGQDIQIEFDFGCDASVNAPGWFLEYVRVGSSAGQSTQIPQLQAGDWLIAEPWHNWIGPEPEVPLRLFAGWGEDPMWLERVEFFYSTDGGADWVEAGIDDDGLEPWYDTQGMAQTEGDGWSTVAVLPVPLPQPVQFKAVAFPAIGDPFELVTERVFDDAPPSLVELNIEDWELIEEEILELLLDPTIVETDLIFVWLEPKEIDFNKGIPNISQIPHSNNHCAPTATAQCFKYFEHEHGDIFLTALLDDHALVDSLAARMNTSSSWGTGTSDWVAGLTSWIQDHGDGYTVRSFTHWDSQGNDTFTAADWKRMRDELERCQNVLSGVFWPGGGGHAMTFNSIFNIPLPNGRYIVDFADPWTGAEESGELDPNTGHIENLSGAGGGGSAQVGMTIVICPKEDAPGSGGPGELVWADPNPWPNPIELTFPYPGPWWVHVDVLNISGHSHRHTRIVDYQPTVYAPDAGGAMPRVAYLSRSNPNPFRAITSIPYALASAGQVSIAVFDVTGRQVRALVHGEMPAGFHTVEWDGRDDRNVRVASGVYYVRMQAGGYDMTRSVTVLK